MADVKKPKETPTRKLPPRWPAEFLVMLAAGRSHVSIAAELGRPADTIGNWAKLPEVVEEVKAIRARDLEEARARLAALRQPAVATVSEVMTREGPYLCRACEAEVTCECGRPVTIDHAPPRDRLRAAEMVLDRVGLPKTEVTELSGAVGQAGPLTAVGKAEVLTAAAELLDADGFGDLAEKVRAAIGGGA